MGNETSSPTGAHLRSEDAETHERRLKGIAITAELHMADIAAEPIDAPLNSNMTVKCAKRWLYSAMAAAVAPRWQRWTHGGVEFEDNETFGDAGLEDGAVIFVSMANVEATLTSRTAVLTTTVLTTLLL